MRSGHVFASTQGWESDGLGLGCGGSHDSWRTESGPKWESERLTESGATGTKFGCEAEAQSDRGAEREETSASAFSREEWFRAGRETETATVSTSRGEQDSSLRVGEEESEGRWVAFNSVSEVMLTVALCGSVTSSSSWSEVSCSDRGQNGSSTCRNIRGITLRTEHSRCKYTTRRISALHQEESASPKVDPSHAQERKYPVNKSDKSCSVGYKYDERPEVTKKPVQTYSPVFHANDVVSSVQYIKQSIIFYSDSATDSCLHLFRCVTSRSNIYQWKSPFTWMPNTLHQFHLHATVH